MRHILCYGDSNTWGYTPGTGVRFSPHPSHAAFLSGRFFTPQQSIFPAVSPR